MADDYLEQLAAEIDMENTYRSRITSGDGSESAGLREHDSITKLVETLTQHIAQQFATGEDGFEHPWYCCTGCGWKGDNFGDHIRELALAEGQQSSELVEKTSRDTEGA